MPERDSIDPDDKSLRERRRQALRLEFFELPTTEWKDESLAPPIDERAKSLLRKHAVGELSEEEAAQIWELTGTFRSWRDAHLEAYKETSEERMARLDLDKIIALGLKLPQVNLDLDLPKWDESLAPIIDSKAKALLRSYVRQDLAGDADLMITELIERFQSWDEAHLEAVDDLAKENRGNLRVRGRGW
jgi:hypothetical protein